MLASKKGNLYNISDDIIKKWDLKCLYPPPWNTHLHPLKIDGWFRWIHFLLNMFSSLGHQGEQNILTTPEAEVEAKQAALEGRDAMILKVPEAPTPEPSGTWIGS